MGSFVVSQVKAGGGTLGICPLPGHCGTYADDFAAVTRWAPGIVVSMTQAQEMAGVGAGALGEELKNAGIEWHHLPIADFGAPGGAVQRAWPQVSKTISEELGRGGRVLVHCRAGCGRSGMIVLRVMVEAGEPASDALLRLRSARACAVETPEQMKWASIPTPSG